MVKNVKKASLPVIGRMHQFSESEVATIREKLLNWYDANHRVLPWRSIAATEPDRNKRAYAGMGTISFVMYIIVFENFATVLKNPLETTVQNSEI